MKDFDDKKNPENVKFDIKMYANDKPNIKNLENSSICHSDYKKPPNEFYGLVKSCKLPYVLDEKP
jgi:hypothetical protein